MKKPFTNESNSPMYVAGVMIPPGEMVLVDVPDEALPPAAPVAPTLAEEVAVLLKKTVKELTIELQSLSSDALDMMDVLEGGAKLPRTSLLTAIKTEQVRRADALLETNKFNEELNAALVATQSELVAAQAALDAATDADARPALEQAVADVQARIDALTT